MDDQKPSSEDKESETSADENGSDVACEAAEPCSPSLFNPPLEDGILQDPRCSSGSVTRRCALCNCGEWSPQGPRKLLRFDPSPSRPQLNPARCRKNEIGTPCLDPTVIGFEESVLPEELFEPSGHCWVHYWCALWSHGVQKVEGTGLVNVDQAVFSGISQKCEYCNRMGATIQCHSTGCLRRYHFPCAAASGSFQSLKTLKLLCTEHVAEAVAMDDSRCMLCDKIGDTPDLIFCTGCGLHYHGSCLEITVTPLKRSGWQCPECKVCQTCRKPGEDSMMLVCDACDKGYHTFCLKPAIEDLPTGSWKCKNCRVCRSCGCRASQMDPGSPWFENYSVCKKCQEQRSLSVTCVRCNQFHHLHCVPSAGCPACSKEESVEPKKDEQDKSSEIQDTALSECEEKPLDVLTPEEDELGTSDNEAAEAPEMLPDIPLPPTESRSPPPLEAEPSPQERIIDSCPSPEEAPVLVTVEDEDMEVEEEGPSETQAVKLNVQLVSPNPSLKTSSLIRSVPDRTWADTSLTEDMQPLDSGSGDCATSCSPPRTKEDNLSSESEQPSALDSEMVMDSDEPHCKAEIEALSIDHTVGQEVAGDFSIGKAHIPIRCTIIKSDIVNEISNLSQGDTIGSYHGSDALCSPEPEGGSLSMEMCLHREDGSLRLCTDSMPETDDSLIYDPSFGKLDGEKSRRKSSPGRSRVKHGRSSSFPGRRRSRGGSGAGSSRGRGRSRLKSTTSSIETLPLADVESSPSKEEEEEEDDTMQNTVVLFSNTDKFVLMQDMCVVCGSFGRGSEGHLLACSQCSQCYHPYCVNSKITKVMLLKGWRCVECIVCEVCGKATDPSRLLLCDDCDISYHTYCLDPPLHTVPKGGWKCKWCVCCMQCGSISPGFHAEWQNNYTHCAPCGSLVSCPVCHLNYQEEDLLIQWLHAVCENLFTEDEVEQAADEGFDCTACQPFIVKPLPPVILPPSPVKVREPEPQYFRFEGVWLTEAGMALLRSLTLSPIQKKKPRRSRLSTGGEIFLDCPEHGISEERKDDAECEEQKGEGCHNESMECDIKLEPPGSPDRDGGKDMETGKGNEDSEDVKKKKRKPYRPGIGGFMIRQRKTHTRSKKGHAAFLEAFRESQGQDQTHPDDVPETPTEGGAEQGTTEADEKKKRRGRKKSKLEDMFPAYLQEAFFGKELMELSKQALLAARPLPQKTKTDPVPPASSSALPHEDSDSNETKTENPEETSKTEVLNVAAASHTGERITMPLPEGALGSDLDKISMEEMPKMENSDIQELLKDVLGTADQDQPVNSSAGRIEGAPTSGSVGQTQRPFTQGTSLVSNLKIEPYTQSGFLDNRDRSGFFSPEHCDTDGSWTTASTPTTPTTEGENDGLSYNQRSLQRWEKDEELGELSTISPVLYANKNFPNLKKDYPDWSSRCKQIMKLWRKVPAQDKAPYLQKAKDNRAAHRINKVQKQAESQINKQSKVEGVRKAERPVLQLQMPLQQGSQTGMNPDYRTGTSGQDLFMSTGSAVSTSSDLFLKRSSASTPGTESSSDIFFKLPPQSPSQEHFPSSPAYPLDPRYPSSITQSPVSSGGFQTFSGTEHQHSLNTQNTSQSMDYQTCRSSTPHHQPESFIKPRYPSGSLDNLSLVGSPGSRSCQQSESSIKIEPMMSPTRYADPKRQTDGALLIKKDDVGSPSFSHSAGSDGTNEMKCDVFKAPLTPRMSQLEPHSPAPSHRDIHMQAQVASPQHHSEMYRQTSTTPYTDPYSQPPLTPRPQPVEGILTSRPLSSDPFSRVPTSPQSQGSSQSPLTPRPLSAEAFCPSPVTPRFQSPDPYSRPPSRPQSRDPFAPPHKPPRPSVMEGVFKPAAQIAHTSGSANYPQSMEVHNKVQASQQQASLFARSPGTSVYQSSQNQSCFTFPHSPGDGVKSSPSHQPHMTPSHSTNSHFTPSKPQSYTSPSGSTATSFHPASSPHSSGNSSTSELYAQSPLRPSSVLPQEAPYQSPASSQRTGLNSPAEKQREDMSAIANSLGSTTKDVPELQGTPEAALSNLSQSEQEKQRQRQRLRELLIRQQIQRNTLRQEKEAAAAALNTSQPGWSGEPGAQSYESSGRLAAYPTQVKNEIGVIPPSPGAPKGPGQVVTSPFSQEERLSTPLPSPSPATVDISVRHPSETPQPFYSRGSYPDQQNVWQSPVAQRTMTPVRFPEVNRPPQSPTVGSGGIVRLPFPGDQVPSSVTVGGAPYIELRHHGQKLPVSGPFSPPGSQNRPRFFLPADGTNSSLMTGVVRGDGNPLQVPVIRNQLLQPQKIMATPPSIPQGRNIINVSQPVQTKVDAAPEIPPQQTGVQLPPAATQPENSKEVSVAGIGAGRVQCEEPPELDVDFDSHKDLEDDDLANLSLDVAKADDDLDNLDNLETNDPHLDDLLNGDEFDLLAYTDPELDTGDKKDIFNEHLRLVESANEKAEEEAMLKMDPVVETKTDPLPNKLQQDLQAKTELEITKDKLASDLGLGLDSCESTSQVTSSVETNHPSYTGDLKPKLEDGGLKANTCQFSASNSVNIKTESSLGTEKVSLGLLKSGSNLHTSSTNVVQATNQSGSLFPIKESSVMANPSSLMLGKFDLDEGPLGLQCNRQSPSDDLDKMESSLVASELPLLMEDLLEHEKKEQQKKQMMTAQHPEGVQPHSMLTSSAMPNSSAPHLQQDGHQANLVGIGLLPRHQGTGSASQLLSPPQQMQQRLGVQSSSTLESPMHVSANQSHLLGGQHLVQTGGHQQQALSSKPILGQQIIMKQQQQQQLVMQQQQQQLTNNFFPDTDLDKFAADDIMDPIAKAKMVALKGIKKVMAQGTIGVTPAINRQQVSILAQRLGVPAPTESTTQGLPGTSQERSSIDPTQPRPNPPAIVQGIIILKPLVLILKNPKNWHVELAWSFFPIPHSSSICAMIEQRMIQERQLQQQRIQLAQKQQHQNFPLSPQNNVSQAMLGKQHGVIGNSHGLVVQQATSQTPQTLIGHSQASALQHHTAQQRQMLIAQQRVLGSSPMAQQQNIVGPRLVLSQTQQNMVGVSPHMQQQTVLSQGGNTLSQMPSTGQIQSTNQNLPGHPQSIHTQQVLNAKDTMSDASLLQEGSLETQGQQQQPQQPTLSSAGISDPSESQNQEQLSQGTLGSLSQETDLQSLEPAEDGQQINQSTEQEQGLFNSSSPLQQSVRQQQNNILSPQQQSLGTPQQALGQENPHMAAPTTQQTSVIQMQNVLGQNSIQGPANEQAKANVGQQLSHPLGQQRPTLGGQQAPYANLMALQNTQLMAQIRAQLQSIIAKNPQLRHLTPPQLHQLQAILIQRHQQAQAQALRQATQQDNVQPVASHAVIQNGTPGSQTPSRGVFSGQQVVTVGAEQANYTEDSTSVTVQKSAPESTSEIPQANELDQSALLKSPGVRHGVGQNQESAANQHSQTTSGLRHLAQQPPPQYRMPQQASSNQQQITQYTMQQQVQQHQLQQNQTQLQQTQQVQSLQQIQTQPQATQMQHQIQQVQQIQHQLQQVQQTQQFKQQQLQQLQQTQIVQHQMPQVSQQRQQVQLQHLQQTHQNQITQNQITQLQQNQQQVQHQVQAQQLQQVQPLQQTLQQAQQQQVQQLKQTQQQLQQFQQSHQQTQPPIQTQQIQPSQQAQPVQTVSQSQQMIQTQQQPPQASQQIQQQIQQLQHQLQQIQQLQTQQLQQLQQAQQTQPLQQSQLQQLQQAYQQLQQLQQQHQQQLQQLQQVQQQQKLQQLQQAQQQLQQLQQMQQTQQQLQPSQQPQLQQTQQQQIQQLHQNPQQLQLLQQQLLQQQQIQLQQKQQQVQLAQQTQQVLDTQQLQHMQQLQQTQQHQQQHEYHNKQCSLQHQQQHMQQMIPTQQQILQQPTLQQVKHLLPHLQQTPSPAQQHLQGQQIPQLDAAKQQSEGQHELNQLPHALQLPLSQQTDNKQQESQNQPQTDNTQPDQMLQSQVKDSSQSMEQNLMQKLPQTETPQTQQLQIQQGQHKPQSSFAGLPQQITGQQHLQHVQHAQQQTHQASHLQQGSQSQVVPQLQQQPQSQAAVMLQQFQHQVPQQHNLQQPSQLQTPSKTTQIQLQQLQNIQVQQQLIQQVGAQNPQQIQQMGQAQNQMQQLQIKQQVHHKQAVQMQLQLQQAQLQLAQQSHDVKGQLQQNVVQVQQVQQTQPQQSSQGQPHNMQQLKQIQQQKLQQIQQVQHILQLKQQMLNQPPQRQLQLQQQIQMHLQQLRQQQAQLQLESLQEPKKEPPDSSAECLGATTVSQSKSQSTSPEQHVQTLQHSAELPDAVTSQSHNSESSLPSTPTAVQSDTAVQVSDASDNKSVEVTNYDTSAKESKDKGSPKEISGQPGPDNAGDMQISASIQEESMETEDQQTRREIILPQENGEMIHPPPKPENVEQGVSGSQDVKFEANGDVAIVGAKGEAGHLLLQKLLRAKTVQLASQRSAEGVHSDINGHIDSKLTVLEQKLQAAPHNKDDPCAKKAIPKPKRTQKTNEKVPNSRKKIRREDSLKSPDAIVKQLKQELAFLPLVEPSITANFSLFAPFGSSNPVNGKSPLKGTFGSGALDSIPDYYTQLLSKSNLSNPPTPPSSLPPTPPPSVQQKMVNGVTASEELTETKKESESSTEIEVKKGSDERNLDLLAALPTPPHNQSEDVRMESDEESDSPDYIVPASSPESIIGEDTQRFPSLCDVKEEEEERALSPVIPLIPRCAIPVFPDVKPAEALSAPPESSDKLTLNAAGGAISWDKGKGSEVSVMLTVSAAAAKNLNGVVAAVAGLLSIKLPNSYEVLFPDSGLKTNVEVKKPVDPSAEGEASEKDKSQPGKLENTTDWLKQLDAVLPGYTLKSELDILTLLTQEETVVEKTVNHGYVNNVSNLDVRQLPVLPEETSPPLSPFVPSPSSPVEPPAAEPEPVLPPAPSPLPPPPQSPVIDEAMDTNKIKQRARPLDESMEEPRPKIKKWKGVRWKRLHILITFQKISTRHCEKEVCEVIERLGTTLKPDTLPPDLRKCCFCHEEGDGATDGPARLLNLDLDLWVHLNCALWSTEVYETQGGALINVEVALHRGLLTKCCLCQKTGATNSCNRIRCPNVYHFACAIRAKCMFFKDKTMLCPVHKLKGPCEQELSCFTVFRRVYIERDEVSQIASIIRRGDRIHMFRVGGLVFHAIGQLLPHQMQDFHSVTALYPVGYEATRIYWSMRHSHRRCSYRCRVCDNNGRPEFSVQVIEYGYEDVIMTDSSPQALWKRVAEPVARMRRETGMLRLFPEYLKGEEMFGLTLHAVLRIAESLPGVENCQNYLFRYGRHPLMELPLMINPTGCARSEPKIMTHYKRPHTLNSTSMSKAYQSTFTGETNTPYSKQFVHSKSSQYRRLKTEWKNNVYLARSRIQGLGLYAAKDLEKHTMVIEYIGTIIRNEVANRREKIYEEQNRGIYMFRINNEHVIDATLTGGPARYINHSCAPNCVAEVVTFDKEDKIIIISSRRIPKGEELTYDYQFDFEDDQHKIPCHCGAWNCRKWMN
uniref:Histone-lysine N-methyltransferase 2D n=1 Tax=Pyxicephalus adspersus TaxID=30357 RepID=A0AAV3B0R4_PYXAD|nr:TPA: hypothetical protein GDO54_000695 [Pyxicephalus adspersus]